MRNFVANQKFILEHIHRLRFIKELNLTKNIEFSIHSNRLIKTQGTIAIPSEIFPNS